VFHVKHCRPQRHIAYSDLPDFPVSDDPAPSDDPPDGLLDDGLDEPPPELWLRL
jgi:hypothetical protein